MTTDRAAALAAKLNDQFRRGAVFDLRKRAECANCGNSDFEWKSVELKADPFTDEVLSCRKCGKVILTEYPVSAFKGLMAAASRPAQDIVAEMRDRLEAEITDCQKLMVEYRSRATSSLSDEWITADEIMHRIGGLQFALKLTTSDSHLSPTKNTAPTEVEES